MSQELQLLLPILLAVGAGIAAMVIDAAGSRKGATAVAAVLLATATAVAVWEALVLKAGGIQGVILGGSTYAAVQSVILFCATCAVIGGWTYFTERRLGAGAVALMAFSAAACTALASSIDLFMTLIAMETIAICAYALVASAGSPRSAEAGMKYLIQGAVATGLFLMGVAIVFGLHGGQSSYVSLSQIVGGALFWPAATSMGLIMAAIAFKMGAFPFHSWAPDVFETAPPAASSFMAGAPKLGAVLAALLIFGTVYADSGFTERMQVLWIVLAVASIAFGNLSGLRQTSYGRMLAYSGIAQIGYALVGLSIGGSVVYQTLVLVSAYAVAVLGAFMAAEAVRIVRPGWDGSIAGMAGIARDYPGLAVALAAVMFSLTGIPLTVGFWGKLLVFVAAVAAGKTWLVVVAVVGSVVSFGYYGGVLRAVFFDDPIETPDVDDDEAGEIRSRSRAARAIVAVAAACVVVAGVVPLFVGLGFLQSFFGFA
ncbi:MAG: NADH-quinone oxidoreductase subunit N [Coriobacteriia bacterium]|nr:NADH-quinone oxidoreductase subunit N [Coriobacteriia bacterium]